MSKEVRKTILFVCVENAGRSQMAEAFFRKYAPNGYKAASAGTRPTAEVNPVVVRAMQEIGIDISKQKPKVIDEAMIGGSASAVNMGCMDKAECPMLFLNNVVDWGIGDPKGKPIEQVRIIRDEIERRVKALVQDLDN
jgi:protein-tyrosine-phosphatase